MTIMMRLSILFVPLFAPLTLLPAADLAPAPVRRLAEVAPRFAAPSDDPAWVMPVGSGDLSAMLRYENAWEIHLSKTDFFGFDKSNYHKNPTILSPGHVQLSFGIPPAAIRSFIQRLDYQRGSVVLEITTADGAVKAEAFGVMGGNTLVIDVEDTHKSPTAVATYSIWRPETSVTADARRIVAREVHDYQWNLRRPDPAKVDPADRMFHLGCGTVIAFADAGPATFAAGALTLEKPGAHYRLLISTACTYDGKPEAAAAKFLDAALGMGRTDLLQQHLVENVGAGFNARTLTQATELTQLMFDYVAFTGDSNYLKRTVAPWLKEAALFYLSYLRKDDDGLYHIMVSDAAENWWKVKDTINDLSAARYLFWQVLNHGVAFGYEPEFIAAVRDRVEKLPPLPVGQWNRTKSGLVLDCNANLYAPFGGVYDDQKTHNTENPELYLVYPFAMVDGNSPKAELDRAVNTFRKRRCPNHAGWSQCPVQAARLRLDDAVDVILDHAKRHAKYPYGGWNSPAGKLKDSKTGATDTPYFDAMGVNLTALEETLLQSHYLTTPVKTDPLGGGPIVLLPAAHREWSGKFRLRARGGFLVTAEFEPDRKLTRATIECERGGLLRLANPFGGCWVTRTSKAPLFTSDPLIGIETQPGDVLEFCWKTVGNSR